MNHYHDLSVNAEIWHDIAGSTQKNSSLLIDDKMFDAFDWKQAVNNTYFDLDVSFKNPKSFFGSLKHAQLSDVSVSYYHANSVHYKRHVEAVGEEADSALITFPVEGQVGFSQNNRDLVADSKSFFIELSHLPYDFFHKKAASLYVIKVPLSLMSLQIKTLEREFARNISLESGVGKLLMFQVAHILDLVHQQNINELEKKVLEQQLINLLSVHLSSPNESLTSSNSGIKLAHLKRIESYVVKNLGHADLSPKRVARACHVSVRYLHQLFSDMPYSYSEWIKQLRLKKAHDILRHSRTCSIQEVAQKVGFGDQSYFSRIYKNLFGYSPKDTAKYN